MSILKPIYLPIPTVKIQKALYHVKINGIELSSIKVTILIFNKSGVNQEYYLI